MLLVPQQCSYTAAFLPVAAAKNIGTYEPHTIRAVAQRDYGLTQSFRSPFHALPYK